MLDIKLKPEYGVLADKQNWGEKYKGWLEPQKYTEIMAKYDDLRPANPVWLALLKRVRTYFIDQILTPILPDEVDIRFVNECFKGNSLALNT
jgi:hypothetical protein